MFLVEGVKAHILTSPIQFYQQHKNYYNLEYFNVLYSTFQEYIINVKEAMLDILYEELSVILRPDDPTNFSYELLP